MIPLADQLAELEREIALRERVYKGWIADRKLTPERAQIQMDRIRAAAATVRKVWHLEQASIEMAQEWAAKEKEKKG